MSAPLSAEKPEPTADGAERRTARRKPLRTSLSVQPQGSPVYEARTLDISVGGMGFASHVNHAPGTRCFVRFQLLAGGRPATLGLVTAVTGSVYSPDERAFRVGLRFVDPPEDVVKVITMAVGV